MKAMLLEALGSIDEGATPLRFVDVAEPTPGDDEVLVRVAACGVCHTELDEIEARTPPPMLPIIPGHQVIGRVVDRGSKARRHAIDDRVGIGWIFRSSGNDDENLDDGFVATGRDVNGGYAELMAVPEAYAYPIPPDIGDTEAAPLLCAGAVGYRALKRCRLENGEVLGLTGFGGSGHLVLQTARYLYPDSPIIVFARSEAERAFALELGATWAGDTEAAAPIAPHAVIDTTPAWLPVIAALAQLRPAGRLVINAIRKESADQAELTQLDYARHLWREKSVTTVANVAAADIAEFLPIAAAAGIRPRTQTYALKDANRALVELKRGNIRGAKVLCP